jgi:hypothetical protein
MARGQWLLWAMIGNEGLSPGYWELVIGTSWGSTLGIEYRHRVINTCHRVNQHLNEYQH